MEWFMWFTKFEHTQPLVLVILVVLFVGISYYVYGSGARGKRIESHKNMIFSDDDDKR